MHVGSESGSMLVEKSEERVRLRNKENLTPCKCIQDFKKPFGSGFLHRSCSTGNGCKPGPYSLLSYCWAVTLSNLNIFR